MGAQCNHRVPYKGKMEAGESESQNEKGQESRGQSNVTAGWGPGAREHRQPLKAGKSEETSSPRASRRRLPCQFISDFGRSRNTRE